MTMTNAERRKQFRIEVAVPVKFRLIDDKTSQPLTEWLNGSSADVSLGGAMIVATMPKPKIEMLIGQYARIELSFHLPGTPGEITATAAIAYFLVDSTLPHATAITLGLTFETIAPHTQDIIGEFIRQRINTMHATNAERRRQFRMETVAPVRFRLVDEKTLQPLTDWMNGSTADVSQGGVKVIAPMPKPKIEMLVDKYVLVEFSFHLPETPNAITATASVAYFQDDADERKSPVATFGLSFVTIDNSAKDVISGFIRKGIGNDSD